jgi:hypothetical protein
MSALRCVCRCKFASQCNKHGLNRFRTTSAYDAMSSCTSNVVILNVDSVYYMSFMIWKCEARIWIRGCLASKQYFNHPQRLVFQTTLSHLNSWRLPRSDSQECAKASGRDGGEISRVVLKFQSGCQSAPIRSSDVMYCMACYCTACIACYCYCTATSFQCRRLSESKSALFNPYTGMRGKAASFFKCPFPQVVVILIKCSRLIPFKGGG